MSMSRHPEMPRRSTRGFALIEIIMFIVIVGFGVAGLTVVMNHVTAHSADPLVRKQVAAMADSVLEEILLKSYCNPATVNSTTNPPACGAVSTNTVRLDFDNVDDYHGKTQAVFLDWPAALAGYSMTISVGAAAAVSGQNMKKVTVTVSGGTESVAVVGYRANF